MAIQTVEVVRDSQGEWVHPQFPEFPQYPEYIPTRLLDEWAAEHSGTFLSVNFEENAEPKFVENWFKGESGCVGWTPQCDQAGAVLLLIHETEDGPEACYFIPN